jgi:hypothetical protein
MIGHLGVESAPRLAGETGEQCESLPIQMGANLYSDIRSVLEIGRAIGAHQAVRLTLDKLDKEINASLSVPR